MKMFHARNNVSNISTSDERFIKTENLNAEEKTNSTLYSTNKEFWVQYEKPKLQDLNASKDCVNSFRKCQVLVENIKQETENSVIRNEIPTKKQPNILEKTICCDSEKESLVGDNLANINSYRDNDQQVDLGGKLELSLTDSMLTYIETIQKNKMSEMFANQTKLEAKMNDYDVKFDTLVYRINELVCNGVKCQQDDTRKGLKFIHRPAVDSKKVSANTPIKGMNDYDQTQCNFEECVCKLIGANNDITSAEVSHSQNDINKPLKHTEHCCINNNNKISKEKNLFPQQYNEKSKRYSACLDKLNSRLYGTVKNNDQNCQTDYNRTTRCSQNRNVQSTINMSNNKKQTTGRFFGDSMRRSS
jgi:hypothetical protein